MTMQGMPRVTQRVKIQNAGSAPLFVRLVPYKWRQAHRWYAAVGGYFWAPCPLCGQKFGGHEWRDIKGRPSSIPDPLQPNGPGSSIGICPACTRAGRGFHTMPQWEVEIYQAIGAASVCWEPPPGGTFQAERAGQIAEDLIRSIRETLVRPSAALGNRDQDQHQDDDSDHTAEGETRPDVPRVSTDADTPPVSQPPEVPTNRTFTHRRDSSPGDRPKE